MQNNYRDSSYCRPQVSISFWKIKRSARWWKRWSTTCIFLSNNFWQPSMDESIVVGALGTGRKLWRLHGDQTKEVILWRQAHAQVADSPSLVPTTNQKQLFPLENSTTIPFGLGPATSSLCQGAWQLSCTTITGLSISVLAVNSKAV